MHFHGNVTHLRGNMNKYLPYARIHDLYQSRVKRRTKSLSQYRGRGVVVEISQSHPRNFGPGVGKSLE